MGRACSTHRRGDKCIEIWSKCLKRGNNSRANYRELCEANLNFSSGGRSVTDCFTWRSGPISVNISPNIFSETKVIEKCEAHTFYAAFSCCLLHASLFFYPENGGDMFLRNIS
jgi:hypothetical protein